MITLLKLFQSPELHVLHSEQASAQLVSPRVQQVRVSLPRLQQLLRRWQLMQLILVEYL